MALIDSILGTKRPASNVAPADADQLRSSLLALHGPHSPWEVKDGSADQVDLVADWYSEPGMNTYHYEVLMRLDQKRREVLALDRLWTTSSAGGGARVDQGNINQRAVGWTLERDENGKLHLAKDAEINTRELKDALRDTVTAAGWTWKGRIRKP